MIKKVSITLRRRTTLLTFFEYRKNIVILPYCSFITNSKLIKNYDIIINLGFFSLTFVLWHVVKVKFLMKEKFHLLDANQNINVYDAREIFSLIFMCSSIILNSIHVSVATASN